MDFSETLTRTRKARGMSQEDLASKIQVSRQAVSKWETGDALPDLNKLLLLADALDISLDELCGRESPVSPAADTAEAASDLRIRIVHSGKARWAWLALCVLLAVCLTAGGLWWKWERRHIIPSEAAPAASTLPDTFTVSGVNFYGHANDLDYQFVPSLSDPSYTYQISFTSSDGAVKTFPAECEGGVCAGTASELTSEYGSLVIVSISDGGACINVPIAQDLSFSDGHAGWTPLDQAK